MRAELSRAEKETNIDDKLEAYAKKDLKCSQVANLGD